MNGDKYKKQIKGIALFTKTFYIRVLSIWLWVGSDKPKKLKPVNKKWVGIKLISRLRVYILEYWIFEYEWW